MVRARNTSLTVAQLVDFALGGNDPGLINFNLLQDVLHIILDQLEMTDMVVQFTGSRSDLIRRLSTNAKYSSQGEYIEDDEESSDDEIPASRRRDRKKETSDESKSKKKREKADKKKSNRKKEKSDEQDEEDEEVEEKTPRDRREKKRRIKEEEDKEETEMGDKERNQDKEEIRETKQRKQKELKTRREEDEDEEEGNERERKGKQEEKEDIRAKSRRQRKEKPYTDTERSVEEEKTLKTEKEDRRFEKEKQARKAEKIRRQQEEDESLESVVIIDKTRKKGEVTEKQRKEKENARKAEEDEMSDEIPLLSFGKQKPKRVQQRAYKLPGTVVKPSQGKRSSYDSTIVIGGQSDIATPVEMNKEEIDRLYVMVESLQDQFEELTKLPSNLSLLEETRKSSVGVILDGTEKKEGKPVKPVKPVVQMYQMMTLTKRMNALEEGMEKLASLIEDLIRTEDTSITRLSREDLVKKPPTEISQRSTKKTSSESDVLPSGGGFPKSSSKTPSKQPIQQLQIEIEKLKKVVFGDDTAGAEDMSFKGKLFQVENKVNQLIDRVNLFDTMFHDQVLSLLTQVSIMEKDVNDINEKFGYDLATSGKHPIVDLREKFEKMENDLSGMFQAAIVVQDKTNDQHTQIQSLLQKVEVLNIRKIGREEFDESLSNKVDLCMINRKVSHDQFNATCDDLSKGIEEALSKLVEQEEVWQHTLLEIQHEITNKPNKGEMDSLHDFVNDKILILQNRLKALRLFKKDQEAAAAKSRYLFNLQCITCDSDVIMRKKVGSESYPRPVSLPPTKTMGPYLAYELDQLRKQQKKLPISRNMTHFTQAVVGPGKYVNRYCGGSHTLTTPQQRVTRVGHFLEQYGNEVSKGDNLIKGTDGNVYKGDTPRDYCAGNTPIGVQGLHSPTEVIDASSFVKETQTDRVEGTSVQVQAIETTRQVRMDVRDKDYNQHGLDKTAKNRQILPLLDVLSKDSSKQMAQTYKKINDLVSGESDNKRKDDIPALKKKILTASHRSTKTGASDGHAESLNLFSFERAVPKVPP